MDSKWENVGRNLRHFIHFCQYGKLSPKKHYYKIKNSK